jgi:general stress protein 26
MTKVHVVTVHNDRIPSKNKITVFQDRETAVSYFRTGIEKAIERSLSKKILICYSSKTLDDFVKLGTAKVNIGFSRYEYWTLSEHEVLSEFPSSVS